MADLTSTIRISGTLNGQKISVTSTMTLEDVYDTGMGQQGDTTDNMISAGFAAEGTVRFVQDTPTYLFVCSRSTCETSMVELVNTGATTSRYLVVPAGGFIILNEYANGAGMVTISSGTPPTSLEGVSNVTTKQIPDIGFNVKQDIMAVFTAAS